MNIEGPFKNATYEIPNFFIYAPLQTLILLPFPHGCLHPFPPHGNPPSPTPFPPSFHGYPHPPSNMVALLLSRFQISFGLGRGQTWRKEEGSDHRGGGGVKYSWGERRLMAVEGGIDEEEASDDRGRSNSKKEVVVV